MKATLSGTMPLWLLIPISLLLSGLIGWADYHASEVQGTVLVLIVVNGALAFASPSHAWLVGLIMGLSIAGTYVVGKWLGFSPVYPIPHPMSTLIALIPAAIGAACGAAARVGVRSAQSR
jgi:nitrogen fixation-related uncharacterized protein